MNLTTPSQTISIDEASLVQGCGCSHCKNGDQHNANFQSDPVLLKDLAVLSGGGGELTPSSIGLNNANELIHGFEWGPGGGTGVNLTFSFPTLLPSHYTSASPEANNFSVFTTEMQTAVRAVMTQISTFANISFTEVTGTGDITLAQARLPDDGTLAYAYYPDQGDFSGDVWFNNLYLFSPAMDPGEVGYFITMHEIGHALGLIHTFEAGLTGAENTEQYSVLSYDTSPWGNVSAETFMLYDVAALQSIYGANTTHNITDTIYILDPGAAYTVWDTGGTDTFDSSAVSTDTIIRLEEGGFSSVGLSQNIAIAYDAVIENATTGTGNDTIYANAAANILNGGSGTDTVNYSLSEFAVRVDLQNGTGTGGLAAGDTFISIENVVGSDDASQRDFIYGNASNNVITGLDGADILEGGAGADVLDGGDGWDYARYTRSSEGINISLDGTDVLTGGDAQGDTLLNIEAIVGSQYNDAISGDENNNYFRGENGDDYLYGGLGFDKLFGGAGADEYGYTGGRDYFYETGSDTDTVIFDAIWDANDVTISGNQFIFSDVNSVIFNDITLFETFIFFTGALQEEQVFTLITLQAYLDSLNTVSAGTEGNDTFIGTSEAQNFDGLGGTDTVDYSASTSAINLDLLNNTGTAGDATGDQFTSIENIMGSDASTQRDTIYGNNDANHIEGLDGADILEGGAGADIIDGGDGWDYSRYTRSDVGININLRTGIHTGGDAEGDTLLNIEAIVGSQHNDILIGGSSNDFLRGENGDDDLSGGNGRDQLYGGNGADDFIFEAASAFNHVDLLRDFDSTEGDRIDISDLLSGYNALSDAITDFVEITHNGSDTLLAVDTNGGADNFVQIASITGIHGLTDEEAIETSGILITV